MIRNLYIHKVPVTYETINDLLITVGDSGANIGEDIEDLINEYEHNEFIDIFYDLDEDTGETIDRPDEHNPHENERYWYWAELIHEDYLNELTHLTWDEFLFTHATHLLPKYKKVGISDIYL